MVKDKKICIGRKIKKLAMGFLTEKNTDTREQNEMKKIFKYALEMTDKQEIKIENGIYLL